MSLLWIMTIKPFAHRVTEFLISPRHRRSIGLDFKFSVGTASELRVFCNGIAHPEFPREFDELDVELLYLVDCWSLEPRTSVHDSVGVTGSRIWKPIIPVRIFYTFVIYQGYDMDILSGKSYDVIYHRYDMDIPNANNLERNILVYAIRSLISIRSCAIKT